MFTHQCTACEKTQLISLTMATSVTRNDEGGLAVEFTCWCGQPQSGTIAPLRAKDVTPAA